jgi:monoamine oxidase
MPISRRQLIHRVGRAGGVAAAYRTMAAMGLLPVPLAYAGPPALAPGSGAGRTVVILGAGIAGMVAALELRKAGYRCSVLEARARAGGRNWTLRGGDGVEETDSTQHVGWDREPHLYFNPGPARIPYHHQGVLSYCRELGVDVEVMCNDNRAALLHDDAAFDGKPQRARAVINDARGYIAELAAKAVDQAALAGPVNADDRERLRAFVRAFGALDDDLTYRGSSRAGYAKPPGMEPGETAPPLDLRRLLQADFWQFKTQFGEAWTMGATMLQPVGGMGRIGEAFAHRLGSLITYRAEAVELRRAGDRARVIWKDTKRGSRHAIEADYVICTIPLPVLRSIPADFSPAIRAAIAAPNYVPAGKVAFQAERRFWELDHQIYGGLSWTTGDITQIWYPTAGLHQRKGILVGAYIWSEREGNVFAEKPPAQRLQDTLSDLEHIHPGCGRTLRHGVSVSWKKQPYSLSGWAEWSAEARHASYQALLDGDGPYLFAGEHVSYVTGWQEGAVLSAHHAIAALARRGARPSNPGQ